MIIKMKLSDYDEKLDAEARQLRKEIPEDRYELKHDPEGCFGGRGNNFGYDYLMQKEYRAAHLANAGYHTQTADFIAMLRSGIDFSKIVAVKVVPGHKFGNVLIEVENEFGYDKLMSDGSTHRIPRYWLRNDNTWSGEISQDIIETARSILSHFGKSFDSKDEFEFFVPTVV